MAVQNFNVQRGQLAAADDLQRQPPSTLTAGQTFVYQVKASDPAGDALTYALVGAPTGMAIDSVRPDHLADHGGEHRLDLYVPGRRPIPTASP